MLIVSIQNRFAGFWMEGLRRYAPLFPKNMPPAFFQETVREEFSPVGRAFGMAIPQGTVKRGFTPQGTVSPKMI